MQHHLQWLLLNELRLQLSALAYPFPYEELSNSLLTFYHENMQKQTSEVLYEFLVIIINLSNFTNYSIELDTFNKCIEILNKEIVNISDVATRNVLRIQIDVLVLISLTLHNSKPLSKEELTYHKKYIDSIENEELLKLKYLKSLQGSILHYLKRRTFRPELVEIQV